MAARATGTGEMSRSNDERMEVHIRIEVLAGLSSAETGIDGVHSILLGKL